MILTSYTIQFLNNNSTIILEAYLNSWLLLGSNDEITWTLLNTQTNINYTIGISTFNVDTTDSYTYFRIVITKITANPNVGIINAIGTCVPGIYKISYVGSPSITPTTIINTIGNSEEFSIDDSGDIIVSKYNRPNNIDTFIGPNTFAGTTSSSVIFGDSTIYGNINIFKNINIVGNITTKNSNYSTRIYSDISVNGNIYIDENITSKMVISQLFNTTSDYRIKSEIIPLDESFSINNLKPVSYYNSLTSQKDIGLIAHELQEYYPYLVHGTKDDDKQLQSITYSSIIALLIHEVQLLKKKISS
jgi:hypothetical protein